MKNIVQNIALLSKKCIATLLTPRAEQLFSGKFQVIPGRSADLKHKCLKEIRNPKYQNRRIRKCQEKAFFSRTRYGGEKINLDWPKLVSETILPINWANICNEKWS